MNKTIDFNELNRLENNEILEFTENRLSNYYKTMFDIEIISLFYKKQADKQLEKDIGEESWLNAIKYSCFDFYILIKDNNKKIFKYKFLKAFYNPILFSENENKYANFTEKLYWFVDQKLCEYCQNKYLKKYTPEMLAELSKKNKQINESYRNYIQNKLENFKQE